jgi:Protein of unknown function (DUF5661)
MTTEPIDIFAMELESGMPHWLSPEGKRWAVDEKYREECLLNRIKKKEEFEKTGIIAEGKTPTFKEYLNRPTPSPKAIAKKAKVKVSVIKKAIKAGAKVEKEHTKHKAVAKEIATDHIGEFPDYYPALDKMEKKLKKKGK